MNEIKKIKEHNIKYNKLIIMYNFINVVIRLKFEIALGILFDV